MNQPLLAALAAEEAAIYAYGIVGVHATGGAVDEARTAEATHRARRDVLVGKLAALNASTAPQPAAYELPFPVATAASALKLAIHVEDGVAAAWRAVLPATERTDRGEALSAMTDSAVRATRWRKLAGVTPVTVAFPGKPGPN
jgi:hypothetical protein